MTAVASTVTDDVSLRALLRQVATIAVVGASPDPSRPSHRVCAHLLEHVPEWDLRLVNPTVDEVLGRPAHPHLRSCAPVDLVCVFRRREALPDVAREAIDTRAGVFWTQLGLWHDGAGELAAGAGLQVVMDRCLRIEEDRLDPFERR